MTFRSPSCSGSPCREVHRLSLSNQKGNALLFVVVSMTVVSVLGTGVYFLTTTATFSGLEANNQNRAYQLAAAGRDYALAKNLPATAGRDFTMSEGNKFRLVINGNTITSTGIVREGTPYETRRTITVDQPGFSSRADITFPKDIAAMGVIQPTSAPGAFLSKTATAVSLGKIGAAYQSQFGAVVYSGNAVPGNCLTGKCDFGAGFTAFFVFQFAAGSTGDGFTFTFFNGSNNTASSVGGYAGQGELLGYAGTSYVSAGYYLDSLGNGIQPPKVAVEFDPFQNGTNAVCASDSRYDASRNHMALMFWGNTTTICGALNGTVAGRYSFDDNRHGAGTDSAADPLNAKSPLQAGWSACSYFNGDTKCSDSDVNWLSNWLLNAPDNVYAFRMEVTRSLTQNASSNYDYRIKAWVKKCGSGDLACAAYDDSSYFANTKRPYTPETQVPPAPPDLPMLDRAFQLDATRHQAFTRMLFGWTTATGGATQEVNVTRFKMNFLK